MKMQLPVTEMNVTHFPTDKSALAIPAILQIAMRQIADTKTNTEKKSIYTKMITDTNLISKKDAQ